MYGRAGIGFVVWALAAGAGAETASAPTVVEGLDVVAATPAPGSAIDRDKLAVAATVLNAADIGRSGVPSLTDAIVAGSALAAINDVEGNAFQPDILFRGFTASPVAGTPEGLAVYVNGARFNEAFGDTVNWDLIPPSAIESATVESANPLFGLNALGGAVNVRLKSGLTYQGETITAYGGSYGRGAGIVEVGRRAGPFALYVTADVTHDGGFRRTSASDLRRVFADLAWRGDTGEIHLDLTAAHDRLGNPGATPVQALDANLSNIFTAPNSVDNQYAGVILNGNVPIGRGASLQVTAYGQTLTQVTPNGGTTQIAPCPGVGGLLCNPDGTVVTGPGQTPVRDFLMGGPYSLLSNQSMVTHAYGAALQVTGGARIARFANRLVAGLIYDGSDNVFAGAQSLGGFDPYTRAFIGPGVVLDAPVEGVNPVRVLGVTRDWGVFATDTVSLTRTVDLTLAGRFNDIRIGLQDLNRGPVNGRHDIGRFNPSVGATWRLAPWLGVYAGYAETNRAPTPQELSCASAAVPCSLLNAFVGDPDLRQVVAHTLEAGGRGVFGPSGARRWTWNADVFRTENTDDIVFQPTLGDPSLIFYANAGRTRRQGVELSIAYKGPRLSASLGYAFLDATFRTPLLLNAGSNPYGDANGELHVSPGDRLPGLPRHRATLVATWTPGDRWTLGAAVTAQSDAIRFGDPSNLAKPVGGYAKLDLNASYRVSRALSVFALVNNALNTRYDTYGAFGPVADVPWPNVPGGVSDPRTASPGAPLTVYGGFRLSY